MRFPVLELAKIVKVTPKQIIQIGPQDMTDDIWLKLVKTINADFSKFDGRRKLFLPTKTARASSIGSQLGRLMRTSLGLPRLVWTTPMTSGKKATLVKTKLSLMTKVRS